MLHSDYSHMKLPVGKIVAVEEEKGPNHHKKIDPHLYGLP